MQQVKWTERKFFFGYDSSYTPVLLERLASTPLRLKELLDSCSEDFGTTRLDGTKWTIKEHAGHLSDLEALHIGRLEDYRDGKSTLRPADMSNSETDRANHNALLLSELSTHFSEKRNQLLKQLRATEQQYFDTKAYHARLQQNVTLADMLYFAAEHDCHHLATISAIIKGEMLLKVSP